ncbi:MAG: tetratricopeptide repeat protein, partial [Zoogloeaceae bacterium]|nr:tetratricopeptide repeat protein [Zoogloeaceae bacterium]
FSRAIENDRDDTASYKNRAFVYVKLGDYKKAIEDYDRAISHEPHNIFLRKARAVIYGKIGKYDKAIEEYKKVIEIDPLDPAARYFNQKAILEFKSNEIYADSFNSHAGAYNDPNDARKGGEARAQMFERYMEIMEKYLNDASVHANFQDLKHYYIEDTLDAHKEIVKRMNPNNANAYFLRATSYGYMQDMTRHRITDEDFGSYEKAIEDYGKAIELNPKFAAAYYNRAEACKNIGKYDNALADYIRAIDADVGAADIYNIRKRMFVGYPFVDYLMENKPRAAADYIDTVKLRTEAIKAKPSSAKAYAERAAAHFEYDEIMKAIADFTIAIKLEPKNADIYSRRAFAYALFGDYVKATEDFSAALRFNPNADDYINRANIHAAFDEYEKAIKDFGEAIKLDKKSVFAYNARALVYKELGDTENAQKDAEKACELGSCEMLRVFEEKGFVDD